MKTKYSFWSFSLTGLLLVNLACSNDDGAIQPNPSPSPSTNQISLTTDNQLGSILVDKDGKSLYFFTKDINGTSKCEGGCVSSWPIYFNDNVEVATGLSLADFGTITRGDGEKQTTYKNRPLYYYGGDGAAGDINGENVNEQWFVAKPDYTLFLAEQEIGQEVFRYLVDTEGKTLYYFTKDEANLSNCSDGCLSSWPEFFSQEIVTPSLFSGSDYETITRADGKSQTTFRKRPLYFFASDNNPGEVNGHLVGGAWFVVKSDLAI